MARTGQNMYGFARCMHVYTRYYRVRQVEPYLLEHLSSWCYSIARTKTIIMSAPCVLKLGARSLSHQKRALPHQQRVHSTTNALSYHNPIDKPKSFRTHRPWHCLKQQAQNTHAQKQACSSVTLKARSKPLKFAVHVPKSL